MRIQITTASSTHSYPGAQHQQLQGRRDNEPEVNGAPLHASSRVFDAYAVRTQGRPYNIKPSQRDKNWLITFRVRRSHAELSATLHSKLRRSVDATHAKFFANEVFNMRERNITALHTDLRPFRPDSAAISDIARKTGGRMHTTNDRATGVSRYGSHQHL